MWLPMPEPSDRRTKQSSTLIPRITNWDELKWHVKFGVVAMLLIAIAGAIIFTYMAIQGGAFGIIGLVIFIMILVIAGGLDA